jgi:hypothetical protein
MAGARPSCSRAFPGILFAVLLPFLMREPRRSGTVAGIAAQAARPAGLAIGPSLKVIGQSRAMVLLVIAASLVAFLAYGKTVWTAIFFIRVHGSAPGDRPLARHQRRRGGDARHLARRLFRRPVRSGKAQEHRPRASDRPAARGSAPVRGLCGERLADRPRLIVVATVLNYFYYGPTFACVQGLVPPQARAMASAVMLFAQNFDRARPGAALLRHAFRRAEAGRGRR